MDFSERLELYQEGGMIDEADVAAVQDIIAMFKTKYDMELCEENADTFIAHLCAALGRAHGGEPVDPLAEEVFADVRELETFPRSEEMLKQIESILAAPMNEAEAQYLLLHLNTLLVKADSAQ